MRKVPCQAASQCFPGRAQRACRLRMSNMLEIEWTCMSSANTRDRIEIAYSMHNAEAEIFKSSRGVFIHSHAGCSLPLILYLHLVSNELTSNAPRQLLAVNLLHLPSIAPHVLEAHARGMKCPEHFTDGRPWMSSDFDGRASSATINARVAIAIDCSMQLHCKMNMQANCGLSLDQSITAPGARLRHQKQYPGLHRRHSCNLRSNVAVHARVKAATVESPANAATDSKPKAKSTSSSSSKLTPEDAADMYRDMKLGRDFEEM